MDPIILLYVLIIEILSGRKSLQLMKNHVPFDKNSSHNSADDINHNVSGRIVGGTSIPWQDDGIPWQVVLLRPPGGLPAYFCGGVLLSNEHILTAAHCKSNMRLDGSDRALVGAKSLSDFDRIRFLSSRYHVHESYETFTNHRIEQMLLYDFMILFLQSPLSNRCPVSFVKLPLVNADTPSNMLNKPLMVVGWGSTLPVTPQQFLEHMQTNIEYPTQLSFAMLYTYLYYVPKSICQLRWQQYFYDLGPVQGVHPHPESPGILDTPGQHFANLLRFDEESGSSMLCASICTELELDECERKDERVGTCKGDSGSGLVYIDPNDPRKIPTLLGIVSFSGACGYAEYPDVFGRVTKILDWIESKTYLTHNSHDHLLEEEHMPCICYN